MSKYIFYNHQTLTDTIDINIYNSYYSFVQNIFLGGIPMISENKLKLGLDINRIHHIISRKMDATVISSIDDNLTVSQAYVIDFIYMEGKEKDIFQKDLEKEFDLKRSSVSLLLNNMEKSDLIQRVPVAEDARLKKIILTEKAMILNKNISMAINSVENKLSENITLEEINVFYRVLDKIRNNLE